jgi:membrane protein YqaA with SNARE-associated domain
VVEILTDPQVISTYGLPMLFIICFAAATILPFSSEIAFSTAIALDWPISAVLITASLGNILGATTNYLLGYFFSTKMHGKLTNEHYGKKVLKWSEKYGNRLIWLNALPLIGDPITILAGIAKQSWQRFGLIVFGSRIARYILLLYIIQ